VKIVVGLGNPGRKYTGTRHNIGFMVVDRLASTHALAFSRQKFKAKIASGIVEGEDVLLVKPQTFMNLTGESVGSLIRFYKRDLSDLLVVYDDVDLPLGKIRLRPEGGSAGHNGIKSIISGIGSEKFARLRIGIRGTFVYDDLSDYVLGKFTSEERAELDKIIERACEAVEATLREPFDKAMSRFN
jgi:PTH1 family peptidyl-tRNA hydrolase